MTALQRGFVWALLATLAFGLTTPLIALAGRVTGVWATAGWLYLGGAIFAAVAQRDPRRLVAGLRARPRTLLAIALLGGMLAPAAYVRGLRDAGPLAASLSLNLEAPLSAIFAALLLREHIGGRAALAMTAIVAGGALLALEPGSGAPVRHAAGSIGVALVVLATALWAADNALSSRLSELDARVTVFWKSLLGGSSALAVALTTGERFGRPASIVSLLAIGAIGYGASLVCYLIAQRRFGVSRTASLFALAPFIGAAGALAAGDSRPGAFAGVAAASMLVGVWLHLTERHAHEHRHPRREHSHPHRHDDLHHDHVHPQPIAGEHAHPHVHPSLVHAHEHGPDPDHLHEHD